MPQSVPEQRAPNGVVGNQPSFDLQRPRSRSSVAHEEEVFEWKARYERLWAAHEASERRLFATEKVLVDRVRLSRLQHDLLTLWRYLRLFPSYVTLPLLTIRRIGRSRHSKQSSCA